MMTPRLGRPGAVAAGLLCLGVVLVLSGPAQAATSTTVVSVTVEEAIEVLAWPDASFDMNVVPEQPMIAGPLQFHVRANGSWGIQVQSDQTGGQLREYDRDGFRYVDNGRLMKRALEWSLSESGPWSPVSQAGDVLFSGQPPTGAEGAVVQFWLRLWPTFDDVRLPAGREYRLVLTYTAGIGY